MSESSSQTVVVTDVHMPFWSMVVFMVKWSIAAIPAVIIIVTIAFLSSAAITGFIQSARFNHHVVDDESPVYVPQSTTQTSTASQVPTIPNLADRCKGSPEPEKCMGLEKKLADETSEQKIKRQKMLDAARQANMSQVK